jgi:hypothetical protein
MSGTRNISGSKLYVQYGSGPFSAPEGWKNYDASPTLKIQRIPLIGKLLKSAMHVSFHPNIMLGNREQLCMWNHTSLTHQVEATGFKNSAVPMFKLVEEENRFNNAVALEATK